MNPKDVSLRLNADLKTKRETQTYGTPTSTMFMSAHSEIWPLVSIRRAA
jgi:hypothetical protein